MYENHRAVITGRVLPAGISRLMLKKSNPAGHKICLALSGLFWKSNSLLSCLLGIKEESGRWDC